MDETPALSEEPTSEEPTRGERRSGPRVGRIVAVLVVAFVLVGVVIFLAVGHTYSVRGTSMSPDHPADSHVWATRSGTPKRGTVVVIKNPVAGESGQPKTVVRRIVALPGDAITAANGRFTIDGAPVRERYLEAGTKTVMNHGITVPKGRVFVAGDRRSLAIDSRQYGPVPIEDIVGYVHWSF